MIRLLQFIYSLYAFLLFALVIILLAPLVILVLPLGRIRGGNLMYDIFRVCAKVWLYLVGIHHTTRYAGPKPSAQEQFIFIANHISYLDAIVIIPSVKHHFRPIGKYELMKIPIFGFIYKFCVITVNRSSAEDRARSLDDLRKVLARGISILVFPEGTFNESKNALKEMYDGAFKLAVETGKKIQPILLLDTFDRLHFRSVFLLTPGRSRAIYLDPIDPADHPHADHKGLKAIAEKIMSEKLSEYKVSWMR